VFHVPHIAIFGTPHYELFAKAILPKTHTCTDKIMSPSNNGLLIIFAPRKSPPIKTPPANYRLLTTDSRLKNKGVSPFR